MVIFAQADAQHHFPAGDALLEARFEEWSRHGRGILPGHRSVDCEGVRYDITELLIRLNEKLRAA